MDAEGLKKLYENNNAVRTICDHMASRERNQRETKLKRILYLLSDEASPLKQPDAVIAFRELEKVGCGKFLVGRRGSRSRFVWEVDSLIVSQVAQGVVGAEEAADGGDEYETETLEHQFNLRSDFAIDLTLPIDLSSSEAERLCAFIRSLPLEEFQE